MSIRDVAWGICVLAGASSLAGCGDDATKAAYPAAAAAIRTAFDARAVDVGALARDGGGQRFSGGRTTWTSPGVSGVAKGIDVSMHPRAQAADSVDLTDVSFGPGSGAALVSLHPVSGDRGMQYDLADVRVTLWGLDIRAGHVRARDQGRYAEIFLEDVEAKGGGPCLASALATRWAGKGMIGGKVTFTAAGNVVKVAGRIGPGGDEADLTGIVSVPSQMEAPGSFLSVPWQQPGRLSFEGAVLSFVGERPDMHGGEAGPVEASCKAIASGAKVAMSVGNGNRNGPPMGASAAAAAKDTVTLYTYAQR